MTETDERRLFARYDCSGVASCELIIGDGVREYQVEDISRGGLRITGAGEKLFEGFAIGQKVRISSSRAAENKLFKDITGTVVWFGSFRGQRTMGIEFADPLESKLDAMLRLFLESDAGRDMDPEDACVRN